MKELGRFDPDLEMFVEKPRDASMNHLRFLRGLAERGVFGPKPLSVPKGEHVFRMTDAEVRRYAMIQGDQELDQKARPILSGGPQSQFEQQH